MKIIRCIHPTGNGSLKNRAFTDTNDASFDSSYSAYLQETKQQLAKVAQPSLNLSQSLSNIVDVSALSLAKDKYFEKPSMVSQTFELLFICVCVCCVCFIRNSLSLFESQQNDYELCLLLGYLNQLPICLKLHSIRWFTVNFIPSIFEDRFFRCTLLLNSHH